MKLNNYDKAVIIMIFILILVSAVCKCQTNDTIKFPLNIQLIDGRNLHYRDYNELHNYTRALELKVRRLEAQIRRNGFENGKK